MTTMKPLFRVITALALGLSLQAAPAFSKTSKAPEARKASSVVASGKKPARVTTVVARQPKAQTRTVATRKTVRVIAAAKAPTARERSRINRMAALPVASFGSLAGLSASTDALGLKSNAVFVIDQNTHEVLMSKNGSTVLPIASLTKLMTGLVVADAELALDEPITIVEDDVDMLKGSGSRLTVGTTLTRGELLHLALMSSENRAAHALGRTFPGGLSAFVQMMNVKAKLLGMSDTQYVDPTGLSPKNQSSAKDLATLVSVAHQRPLLRDLSTSAGYEVDTGRRTIQYHNTNRLVSNPEWDIGLQKTGYIAEAGRCLVMQAKIAGRQLILVFLDSAGKFTRIADAERVRRWIESM